MIIVQRGAHRPNAARTPDAKETIMAEQQSKTLEQMVEEQMNKPDPKAGLLELIKTLPQNAQGDLSCELNPATGRYEWYDPQYTGPEAWTGLPCDPDA
jgi:hypothetical protein